MGSGTDRTLLQAVGGEEDRRVGRHSATARCQAPCVGKGCLQRGMEAIAQEGIADTRRRFRRLWESQRDLAQASEVKDYPPFTGPRRWIAEPGGSSRELTWKLHVTSTQESTRNQ